MGALHRNGVAIVLLLLSGAGMNGRAMAASVRLRASPASLTIADTFQLDVVISGATRAVQPPTIKANGFSILSRRQSVRVFNGRGSTIFSYEMKPTRTGTITIPALTVEVDGQAVSSRRGVSVEVQEIPRTDDFILELTASPQSVYVEQEVALTLKLWALRLPGSNAAFDPFAGRQWTWPRLEIPWFEEQAGFTTKDFQTYAQTLQPQKTGGGFPINDYSYDDGFLLSRNRHPWRFRLRRSEALREDARGRKRSFFVYTLTKTFRAAAAGSHKFAPVTARGKFLKIDDASGQPRATRLLARSDGVTVVVRGVPTEDRPDSFTGAVGRHIISASIAGDGRKFGVGEPMTLSLTIRGGGKLESIGPISLKAQKNFVESFRVAEEPEVGDLDPTRGTKTFVYSVRPRHADVEAVPPIRFSYFDLDSEAFVEVQTVPLPIDVQEGKTVGAGDVTTFDESLPVTRIRKIRRAVYPNHETPDALEPQRQRQRFTWIHGALLAVPPVLYLLLLAWTARKRQLEGDPRILRARDAGRRARATLANVAVSDGDDAGAVFRAISHAVTGLVADRLHLPSRTLTPAESLEALKARGVDVEVQDAVGELLDACEQVRYDPSTELDPTILRDRATGLLRTLERELR